jgi:hypothetical protein
MTDADRVWNRAAYREGADLRHGDRALGALLLVDGYIQNGGVCHAFDLTAEELGEGIAGYEFFGLHDLVAIIKPHDGEDEGEYNKRYYESVNRDIRVRERFEEMFRQHPERFAPLRL